MTFHALQMFTYFNEVFGDSVYECETVLFVVIVVATCCCCCCVWWGGNSLLISDNSNTLYNMITDVEVLLREKYQPK